MITQILQWLIDVKIELDSIQLASLLGVQWVGTDLTMWDVFCVFFFCETLISIFFPHDVEDDVDGAVSDV